MMTNRAIYNLGPGKYNSSKRRIPFALVGSVTKSKNPKSNEFVIHVPAE